MKIFLIVIFILCFSVVFAQKQTIEQAEKFLPDDSTYSGGYGGTVSQDGKSMSLQTPMIYVPMMSSISFNIVAYRK